MHAGCRPHDLPACTEAHSAGRRASQSSARKRRGAPRRGPSSPSPDAHSRRARLEALHKVAPRGAALQRARPVMWAGRQNVRPAGARRVAITSMLLEALPLLRRRLLLGLARRQLQQLRAGPLDV